MSEKCYVTGFGLEIEEAELVKETEKTFVVKGLWNFKPNGVDRIHKSSSNYNVFKTREEAINYLIEREEKKLQHAIQQVEIAKLKLQQAKELK